LPQKIWPMLKFLKSGSNFKVKVTRSKTLVPSGRSCHKEHTYEIWKPYHLPFKRYMVNVKVFADRQTGQKLYAPDLSIRWHKKKIASVGWRYLYIVCYHNLCSFCMYVSTAMLTSHALLFVWETHFLQNLKKKFNAGWQ
jgi:hypothetical protein